MNDPATIDIHVPTPDSGLREPGLTEAAREIEALFEQEKQKKQKMSHDIVLAICRKHGVEYADIIVEFRRLAKYHEEKKNLLKTPLDGLLKCRKVVTSMSALRDQPGACITAIEHGFPSIFNMAYPRRYNVPGGYASPRLIASVLFWTLWDQSHFDEKLEWGEATLSSRAISMPPQDQSGLLYCTMASMIEFAVPTYFIGDQFVRSLINTDLPKDLVMAELPWPMPAMLYIMPPNMLQAPDGWVTHMMVTRLQANREYRINGVNWDNDAINSWVKTEVPAARASDTMSVVALTSTGKTLMWECPLDRSNIHDAATAAAMRSVNLSTGSTDMTPDEEVFASRNLPEAALQIMLGMIACPELREDGECIRRAKDNGRGKRQSELWNPNFIGRTWRYERDHTHKTDSPEDGESHRVRTHWRRAHFRHYRHPDTREVVHIKWIKRMIINKPKTV